jgi:hypothetical protein|tara:strand:+ start:4118 stop:5176 length:1059 start_codon:yes stop_codon:yes gene_type:complete
MAGTLKVGGNTIATHTGVEGTGQVSLTNVSLGGGAFMFRNKIINGGFDIWQRGTSFTISNSTNTYSTDRWRFLGSAFTGTLTRENFSPGQTEVPNNPDYFAKWTVTTNPAGNMAFGQYIENVRTLAGKTATLSLYLKSSSTISADNLQIRYRQVTGGTGGTNNAINIGEITTAWKKFTFQLNIPSLTGAGLGTPNVSYLALEILSPSAHTSAFDLSIAQVQLEEGTAATPFEHRPIGVELSLCQRYFEKSYDLADGIGGNSAKGMIRANARDSGSFHRGDIRFKVSKRSLPEIKIYAYYSGTLGHYRDTSNGVDRAALSQYIGENSFEAYASGGVMSTGALHGFHYTANSEL